MVVQRPQEGVPVRSLEESILDLHLPPAQLLAASKPLGQLQDALPLVHLLLDGVEALLHGFGGRSEPGVLQERNRYQISTAGCLLRGCWGWSSAARGSRELEVFGPERRRLCRLPVLTGPLQTIAAHKPSPQRGSSIARSRAPTAPTPAALRSLCRFPAALGTGINSAPPPPPRRRVCRTPPEQSTSASIYAWNRERHNRRGLSGAV